jgi:hypothetical protein
LEEGESGVGRPFGAVFCVKPLGASVLFTTETMRWVCESALKSHDAWADLYIDIQYAGIPHVTL